MPNLRELENAMPVAPLKIIPLSSMTEMGKRINEYMVDFRNYVNKDLELLATTVYSLVKDQKIQDQLRQDEISNLIRK